MDTRNRQWNLAAATVIVALLFGPALLAALRAIVNLPVSAASVVWAQAHGADCTAYRDLTIACSRMDGGFSNQGTTFGNVWLFDEKGGPARQRHEAKHSTEWALFGGGPAFPLLYAGEHLRAGDIRRNVFERWADLEDGGWGGHPAD